LIGDFHPVALVVTKLVADVSMEPIWKKLALDEEPDYFLITARYLME
jgi:hypothetical protein